MGYEKPSTKLTFYKAFFSSQWKFLIYTILQSMSVKRTSWNKFSSSMASDVICISTGKGCSGVETPLFEGMIMEQQVGEGADKVHVKDVPAAGDEPSIPSPTPPTQPPPPSQDQPSTSQGRIIANMDADVDVTLKDIAKDVAVNAEIEESADVQGRQAESQAQIYQINFEHADKVLSMQDDEVEPAKLQEVTEVVIIVKLITEVVTAASAIITDAAPQLTIVVAPTLTTAPGAARRRKGAKSLNLSKKQVQIEQDEAYSKELEAELNKNIDWDEVIDHVHRKEKEDNVMKSYQALERKPQTEAQARKNMMIYLRNVAGFKMDYFMGMTYDDICPIFEKKFNSNKLDEEVEELRKHLQIVLNEDDDIYTKATPLVLKVPVVDFKIYTENNKPYYKIKRADGSHQLYLHFLSMLRNFNREDLESGGFAKRVNNGIVVKVWSVTRCCRWMGLGIDATVTTAKFLNENLWKDDKRLRKLRNMEMDARISATKRSVLLRRFNVF
nr:hypothetical protein [Tanacetum cinerariifolium]